MEALPSPQGQERILKPKNSKSAQMYVCYCAYQKEGSYTSSGKGFPFKGLLRDFPNDRQPVIGPL